MSYKRWLIIASFLFGIGVALGLVTPASVVDLLPSEDIAAFEELGRILTPFEASTAIFIFIKNTSVLLISFVLSPILCLVPLLTLIVNGWFLTFVSVMVVQEESLGYVLAGLLPHGIFELPALLLGQAAALSFGIATIRALLKKESKTPLLAILSQNLKYLLVALALLLPAAVIETYITPLLLS